MNKKLRVVLSSALALAVFGSPAFAAADFSRYVSLGDSLTAGVISASIGEKGQLASYPLQINEAASSGDFPQPLVSEPGTPGRLTLKSLSPLVISPEPGNGVPINLLAPFYRNLGVSGANVSDTLRNPGVGSSHSLVLRGLGTAVQQALAQDPTFISLWIGNNDVLGAAVSGLVIEGVTITPVENFEADYRAVAETLATSGADMAFANLPSPTAIPYVTALPPVLVDPVTQLPVIIGGLTVPLIGENGPLTLADKVLLPAGALLAAGTGIPVELGGNGQPLPDTVVLDAEEVATIEARIAAFNGIIATVAAENGAALVDMNGLFSRIASRGVPVGGIRYTAELFGGLFSYDGVHGSPLGYAVVANEFIRTINRSFSDSISLVSYVPFVNGGGGNIGTLGIDTSAPSFTRRAQRNMRKIFNLPSPRRLAQLKRRQEQQEEAGN